MMHNSVKRGIAAFAIVCGLAGALSALPEQAWAEEPSNSQAMSATSTQTASYENMYRMYNPNGGEHFYTANLDEAKHLLSVGWRWEGIGWVAPKTSGIPVYRLYNEGLGDHLYTIDKAERDLCIANGWTSEEIGWYGMPKSDSAIEMRRQFNPNATTGSHNYTSSEDEWLMLERAGWHLEGVAFYAAQQAPAKIQGFWSDTSAWGVEARYWIDSDAEVATNRIVRAAEGAGYDAFAREDGTIVQGVWKNSKTGALYLADSNGKLEAEGWSVSDAYGGGLQRYFVDADARTAKTGFFKEKLHSTDAQASSFYADPQTGRVLRGANHVDGGLLLSDNDGVLAETSHGEGWMTSSSYGRENARYYLKKGSDGHLYAQTGFFTAPTQNGSGKAVYFARSDGSLVVGKYLDKDNGVIVTDATGRTADTFYAGVEGMKVTDVFDGGLQRYFFVQNHGHTYAKTGLFEFDGKLYYGSEDDGFLVRNTTVSANGKDYLANNDAELTETIVNRKRDTYLRTVTWTNDKSYIDQLRAKAAASGSTTGYAIVGDFELCRLIVFQQQGSTWVPIKIWNANMARNRYIGTWTITDRQKCNWDDSYFGKGYNDWSTCFIESYANYNVGGHSRYIPGKGWEDCAAIHSTGYDTTGYDNTGCIGLLYENAKWVYDNIPDNTKVVLFE